MRVETEPAEMLLSIGRVHDFLEADDVEVVIAEKPAQIAFDFSHPDIELENVNFITHYLNYIINML